VTEPEASQSTETSGAGDDLQAILEAMLFAAHESLSAQRLARALGHVKTARVEQALRRLEEDLEKGRSPLQLVELAEGFRLVTRPEYAPYLGRLFHRSDRERLSAAALETLAIVAWRQPITRADVEGIRGVQVGPVLRMLQERHLIKVVGRAPVVGRPQQYGTTRRFLDLFGLGTLEDLPRIQSRLKGRDTDPARTGPETSQEERVARIWLPSEESIATQGNGTDHIRAAEVADAPSEATSSEATGNAAAG